MQGTKRGDPNLRSLWRERSNEFTELTVERSVIKIWFHLSTNWFPSVAPPVDQSPVAISGAHPLVPAHFATAPERLLKLLRVSDDMQWLSYHWTVFVDCRCNWQAKADHGEAKIMWNSEPASACSASLVKRAKSSFFPQQKSSSDNATWARSKVLKSLNFRDKIKLQTAKVKKSIGICRNLCQL